MKRGWDFARKAGAVAALLAFASGAAAIDDWDAAAVKDNTASTTRNLLYPGAAQTHDLQAFGGIADEDWFVVNVELFRQYQVHVGEVTGDTPVDNIDFLELWDGVGSTMVQSGSGSAGVEKFVRFFSNDTTFRVRVKGNANSPATSRYSIRLTEATMYCPRYNNSGTQVSVLIVQNVSNASCDIAVDFFNETGGYVATFSGTALGNGMVVLPAGSIPAVVGTKGSVQLHPFCSPSALKAKMVALEPSTGFSFDTLCERP
jgi:hypothetical protein